MDESIARAALHELQAGTLTVSTLEGTQHADLTGASHALRAAVAGRAVSLEIDPAQGGDDRQLGDGSPGDSAGAREFAYVYVGRTAVNQVLLRGGFGTEYAFRPYRLQPQFRSAERYARQLGLGVWSPGRCSMETG